MLSFETAAVRRVVDHSECSIFDTQKPKQFAAYMNGEGKAFLNMSSILAK